MPSTLVSSNEELLDLINSTPNIKVTIAADNAAFDAIVTANDNELIDRFGPHPTSGQDGFMLRRITLARLCAIDLTGGDVSERIRALARVGPLYR